MFTSLLWHLNLLMGNLFPSHLQGKYFFSPWRWWSLNPSAHVVVWPAWRSPGCPQGHHGEGSAWIRIQVCNRSAAAHVEGGTSRWPKSRVNRGKSVIKEMEPTLTAESWAGEGAWTAMEMGAPCTKAVLGHCWAKWGQSHQERIPWQQEGNWALRMERELLGHGRSGAPWSAFQAVVLLLYTREKKNNTTTHNTELAEGWGPWTGSTLSRAVALSRYGLFRKN